VERDRRTFDALAGILGVLGIAVLFVTALWPGVAISAVLLVGAVGVYAKGHPGFFSP
jgi:multisubunit Na+/H+ antiporter MnhB subunit